MLGKIRRGIAISSLLTLLACSSNVEQPADLVFSGGGVYTVNQAQPWAETVAIRDGRIIFVGDDDGAWSFIRRGPRESGTWRF